MLSWSLQYQRGDPHKTMNQPLVDLLLDRERVQAPQQL
jgi:hypothetical protein